jgi:hypothetical protein
MRDFCALPGRTDFHLQPNLGEKLGKLTASSIAGAVSALWQHNGDNIAESAIRVTACLNCEERPNRDLDIAASRGRNAGSLLPGDVSEEAKLCLRVNQRLLF